MFPRVAPLSHMLENIFEKIADNEYTLAKWLSDMEIYFCSEISCSECVVNKECWHQGNDTDLSNYDLWLSWLKRKL